MKTEKNEKRLEFFDSLYQSAKSEMSDVYDRFELNTEQYYGSDKIDNSYERASAVRNITYELIESQVSSEIPAPYVSPARYSERRERNARSAERLLSQVRDALPFEQLNDIDERYTYILGGSVWFVEWDSSILSGREHGGVRIHCINPRDFIPEPNIYKVADMEYCFMRFDTTRADVIERYGVSEEDIPRLSSEGIGMDSGAAATVIVCFYRNESRLVSQFAWCGDVILSDIENYYARKIPVCPVCGAAGGVCDCNKESVLTEEIIERVSLGEIADAPEGAENGVAELPYYTPSFFPIVIRKNTSKDCSLMGQSDCEFIRCQQQQINKIESRIMQKLMRSGITPIVPDDAEIALNNQIFGQVLKLRPSENSSMYGTIDTTPDISQDIQQADRLYEQAKRIVGISDAYQGFVDNDSTSGVARQLMVNQSAGRLDSKKSMKNSAYAELDRIIFSYYLAYADEPKALSYKDTFGRIHNLQFNRHDFIEYDPVKGEYYYDDGYLFSVDTSKSVEQQREYIWQKNLENLRSGTLGNPESTETLLRYWQCQERAHYPFARDNVEYFSALLQRENVASKPTDKPLDSPKKPEPLPTEKDAEQYIPAPAKDGE